MKLLKELFMALLPIIALMILGFIAYGLFNLPPSADKSEHDDIQILIGFWLSLMPIVLVFLVVKSNKTNKD